MFGSTCAIDEYLKTKTKEETIHPINSRYNNLWLLTKKCYIG